MDCFVALLLAMTTWTVRLERVMLQTPRVSRASGACKTGAASGRAYSLSRVQAFSFLHLLA
jgi:hypothetical protein